MLPIGHTTHILTVSTNINMSKLLDLIKSLFKKDKSGKIYTHKELQEQFGLYAENRPEIKLDPEKVPQELRDLVPLAEKWGIGDDIMRYDFGIKASMEEKQELSDKFNNRHELIRNWLNEFGDAKLMTDEAAAYMYMAIAVDETN